MYANAIKLPHTKPLLIFVILGESSGHLGILVTLFTRIIAMFICRYRPAVSVTD